MQDLTNPFEGQTDGSWQNGSQIACYILACMLKQSLTGETQFESQNIIANIELLSKYNCKTILVQRKLISLNVLSKKPLAKATGAFRLKLSAKYNPLYSLHSKLDTQAKPPSIDDCFQSNFWQMTAQISGLAFLKFKMAFSVLYSSEKLADDVYLKLHLITRR